MDPYNQRRDPENYDQGLQSRGMHALIPGLVLVGIGALFLLDNLRIVHADSWIEYWPVILIAVGLVQLVDSGYTGGRVIGGCLMGAGAVILAGNLGFIYFNIWDLWPLALIAAGLLMIWSRTHPDQNACRLGVFGRMGRRPFQSAGTDNGNVVHEFAIFGGSKRIITSPDFQGGTVSSVFGGISLDLTASTMAGSAAVLHVSAIYGGISVRVPPSWTVEMRGAGIFGGFTDNTLHPAVSSDMKRLIVKGGAVFGGIVVKN